MAVCFNAMAFDKIARTGGRSAFDNGASVAYVSVGGYSVAPSLGGSFSTAWNRRLRWNTDMFHGARAEP
jgi:hypothetical protein